jgi:hypothetical protein
MFIFSLPLKTPQIAISAKPYLSPPVFRQLDVSAPSGVLIDASTSVVTGLSFFPQRALSDMHVPNASTISILKRSGSNSSPHPPTGRPFIRSRAFLTTTGPQLAPSFCCGVGLILLAVDTYVMEGCTYRLNIFKLQVTKFGLIQLVLGRLLLSYA